MINLEVENEQIQLRQVSDKRGLVIGRTSATAAPNQRKMEIQTPYLDAIQLIPGETIGEKYKWIAKFINHRISECNSLEQVVENSEVPRLLAPLIKVQAAQALNKRDPNNQDNCNKAVAKALKSDNVEVVRRALQMKSFFDGSSKMFTNVDYFINKLLPFVSLNTRVRIIKNLSIHLKETALAEEFFIAIAATYSLNQALPLLPACSESFIFDTVVNKRIVLSRKLVKMIFRKYPDLVVRYLRLSKPSEDPCDRNLHKVDIRCMEDFLPALIKKRLSSFVELFEMHENVPLKVKLSKKRAAYFLKNGKDHLLRKPKLYMKLVPLQMISVSTMEALFPKLLPENMREFCMNGMFQYLEYYPEEKKADLVIKSCHDVYGVNVLDRSHMVAYSLMLLLPVEERIHQAKIKIRHTLERMGRYNYSYKNKMDSDIEDSDIEGSDIEDSEIMTTDSNIEDSEIMTTDYRLAWRCYLPTDKTIPEIKRDIARSSKWENRALLVTEMIYNCKVNCEDQTLLNVLMYVRDRHKNEISLFLLEVLRNLMRMYNLPRLNKDVWAVLMDIILRAHVKNDLIASNYISVEIIETAIHFRIINEQPIDKEIDILVDLMCQKSDNWNILKKYPEHEKRCLEACIAVVSQRFSSDASIYKDKRDGILYDLNASIYAFNKTHSKNCRVEPMSIKNYPWLLKEIERIIQTDLTDNYYILEGLKSTFRANEKDLAERLFGRVLKDRELSSLLKKSPKSVLSMWKECLTAFHDNFCKKSAKTFMRTARWYNEIPVKFLQQSLEDLRSKKDGVCLEAIALLVHGKTLVKILKPLMPTDEVMSVEDQEAKGKYSLTLHVISCTKSSNPPVPFSLLCRYCEGDYLTLALRSMVNLCRRSLLTYVVSFARTLATQRVSVRKHGIRMMQLVASKDQLHRFFLSLWKKETHYSILDVLFSSASKLFSEEPGPTTWFLIKEMILQLDIKNDKCFIEAVKMVPSVPDMYVADFVKVLLDAADNLRQHSMCIIYGLINAISPGVCNLLPEEVNKRILQTRLFSEPMHCAIATFSFAQNSYLMAAGDKFEVRMNTFTEILVKALTTRWNVSHPGRRPHFCMVNHSLRLFTEELAFNLTGPGQLRIVDGILNAFLKVLTPTKDPNTYLLLVFRREQVAADTPKAFGLNLGQKLEELIRIFSPLFIGFMTNILNNLLSKREYKPYDPYSYRLSVIEGLVEVGTVESTLIAVGLMTPVREKKYVNKYDELMGVFLKYNHPAVKSIACDNVNKVNDEDLSPKCY